ncbi:TPA: hypothetical protein DDZ86_04530 [Candidatus Dependentiae bacterium]|nr:MAG: hypothetical protein UW09_C0002G0137 [candidate division TM6 bacterium GW2011_GWF2_43_87]HBL98879.1 hypothetical protein [Candidatus Dependentiae bacterium]
MNYSKQHPITSITSITCSLLLASPALADTPNIPETTSRAPHSLKAPSNYISLEKQQLPFVSVITQTVLLADADDNVPELRTVADLIRAGRKFAPKFVLKTALLQAQTIFERHADRITNIPEREILKNNITVCLSFFNTHIEPTPTAPIVTANTVQTLTTTQAPAPTPNSMPSVTVGVIA